jgi:hypothetical protein
VREAKTPFFYCCVRVRSHESVFTEPLLRNGRLFIRLLRSNCCIRCLFRGVCLATGLHATISLKNIIKKIITLFESEKLENVYDIRHPFYGIFLLFSNVDMCRTYFSHEAVPLLS